MSPRPRTVSDADILEATLRAVSRVGPVRLTLADVSREAGVAPATLLQRFGSKRGLLLALAREGANSSSQDLVLPGATPLESLRNYAACMAGMAPTPEVLANHLTFLVMDLTDPGFHELTLNQAEAFQLELAKLFQAAIDSGELKPADPIILARLLQDVIHGALVSWAIHREGTSLDWVLREFNTLIEPYRT